MKETKEEMTPGMVAHRNRCGNGKPACECQRCWPVGSGLHPEKKK